MQKRLTVQVNHSFQTVMQMVAVLYLMVWSIAPPLQIDLVFRLLALGLAVVWFFIEFLNRFEFTNIQIWCAIFMVAVALMAYLLNGVGAILAEISVYMMVLAYFISIYSADSWQNYKIVVPLTLGLLIFFNYRTVTELVNDPTIARLLVRDTPELYDYMRRGVGGYGLVYPQVVIAPVVYAWTLMSFRKNKFFFFLGVAWAVSFFALILNAGYSIAVIVSVISLAILIFYRRQSVFPAFIISFALIAAIVLMLVYVESFRNLIMQIFDGTKVVRKIEDLLSTAEGETADSFANRIERYWWSIQTCFQYPIIGCRLFGGRVGGHSELLDTFAKYGVWGGIPLLLIIFHTPHYFKTAIPESSTIRATANAHITAIALVALLDPYGFTVFFPLLILCPIMYSDIIKWRESRK
ncbi:MAG: hypothetical protein IJL25_09340 [Clostridia bacterium]|nr:hypothetical protein [Clostridia bacterium]